MQFLLARGVVEVGFGFPGGASGKESASSAGDTRDMGSIPGSGRSPGGGIPTPVFFPGDTHGQRSLVGYSPWGCRELDTTEPGEPASLGSAVSSCTWCFEPRRIFVLRAVLTASPQPPGLCLPGLPLVCVHQHPSPVWNLSSAYCRPCFFIMMLLLFLPQSMPQSRCLTHTC